MKNAYEKPGWFFYVGWVTLSVIAVITAWYITLAIVTQVTNMVGDKIQLAGEYHITEDLLYMNILVPIIGLLTGFFQYLLLRRYLARMRWWVAATLVVWLTPLFVRFIPSATNTLLVIFAVLLIGTTMVLPQWWILRQRVGHAFWWLLAFGLGWGMVGFLKLVTSEPLPVLLGMALIPAITTGVAWWLLLDWLPKRELKSSLANP
jgi:hypothetical protein